MVVTGKRALSEAGIVDNLKQNLEANKSGGYLEKIKMIREKRNLLDPDHNWF